MSDIFEQDINESEEDLKALEDKGDEDYSDASFVYPKPLFKLKLEYSCEGIYATAKKNMTLKPGDYVIIPTRYGNDLARNLGESEHPIGIRPADIVEITRLADTKDLNHAQELKERTKQAEIVFKEKVALHNLDMKLVSVHFLVGEQKVIFFFSSENRVDFRELVKDLVTVFKMRIELRQIGVRDESRLIGGLGVCGRPFCCHAINEKLPSVSIKMAKEQNLSLNSAKISGQCGRLLCCLSYECKWYEEVNKSLPNEGVKLFYDNTPFRVTEVNAITAMVKITGEDGRILEINAKRFTRDNGRWKIKE